MKHGLQFRAQGDAALLAYLGQEIDPQINARVRVLARVLGRDLLSGVRAVLGAYSCLQVQFDPLVLDPAGVEQWVSHALAGLPEDSGQEGRLVEIPVVYGGEHGPDLEFVAGHTGLDPAEVVRRHSGASYLCYLVGFTPGFPFLGGMDPTLAVPRLESPRLDLPVGAVGIGGDQTGLYSLGGPGGWRVIGRTPLHVYDPAAPEPCLVRAGDRVRFVPVERARFQPLRPAGRDEPSRGRPVFRVKRPGSFTTVQDGGRWGFQDRGVPVSGALDRFSLAAANRLLGNPPHSAALELTLLGPRLEVLAPVRVALCGADLGLRLDGRPAPYNQVLELAPGQVLDFSGPRGGSRAILALAGGVEAPVMLGSRSVHALGLLGGPLTAGDLVRSGGGEGEGAPPLPPAPAREALARALEPRPLMELRVIPGPQEHYFSVRGRDSFYGGEYTITAQSDRRGVRLQGPVVEMAPGMPRSILSEPNTPGVVQVPPGGQPIILLNEQTVGGYAKMACVISADLGALARALPGQRVRFRVVDQKEARRAAREQAQLLLALAGEARGTGHRRR